jgi:hypothetical protein
MESLEVKQITSCVLFNDMSGEHIMSYIKEQVQSLTFMHQKNNLSLTCVILTCMGEK